MDCDRPIRVLSLSLRATNRLRARGVWTVAQLLQVAAPGTAVRRELGPDLGNEIDIALKKHGYAPKDSPSSAIETRPRKRVAAPLTAPGVDGAPAQRGNESRDTVRSRRDGPPARSIIATEPAKRAMEPVSRRFQSTKNEVRLYRVGDRWVVRLEVTQKMLRGAGRALPAAVGSAIGCRPGSAMWHFRTRVGGFIVSWPADRPSGPYLGSLERDLKDLEACEGDLVFLEFHGQVASVRLLRAVPLQRLTAPEQVARLVGLRDLPKEQSELWRLVANAIEMPTSRGDVTIDSVCACLRRRGEVRLAELAQQANTKDRSILDDLESILGL